MSLKTFFAVFCLLSLCCLNIGCAAGAFVGRGALMGGLARTAATDAAILGARTFVTRSGAGTALGATARGVTASLTIKRLRDGTLKSASQIQLLNAVAASRRVGRIGLTAPLIEEVCFMRAGSYLISVGRGALNGGKKSFRLLNGNGKLIAELERDSEKISVRDPNGGIVSSSVKVADRIVHYSDAAQTKAYGYTIVDREKRQLRHFVLDALGEGLETYVEDILTGFVLDSLPAELTLTPEILAEIEDDFSADLFEGPLQVAADRINQPLMLDPKPPRNQNFTVAQGTVVKSELEFEVVGFVINAGYETDVTLKVKNLGRSTRRIAINAVGEQGFRAPPYVYAKLTDSSGFKFHCVATSGIFYQAKLIGMDDGQYIVREQIGGYESKMVERWLNSMDRLESGDEQIVTFKYKLPDDVNVGPNLDLNFTLSLKLYGATEQEGAFGRVQNLNVDLQGIVPHRQAPEAVKTAP